MLATVFVTGAALSTPTDRPQADPTAVALPPGTGAPQSIPPLSPSTPQSLRIPAIDLSIPLISLGLNADGTVEVPTDYAQAGWYRHGPTPGEAGSAVILGHVDSYQGPAVFSHLRELRPGDRVEITRADSSIAEFAVTTVATYPKTQFPAEQVYANTDGNHLQLVTCGGDFDSQARSYRSNVVVYTTMISTSPDSARHPTG
ncbi:class F sortase [Aldersonia sp. NBC_00410]|uniref:class F sortase n=1 Tax=Aldersonia sp. NBC_00410 TaxID=2975954 RepID=UPI00225070C3|nr:class F sortase [Aldersonia sp. NBC_00410]MCX5046647.1 class F sortase [Aldersonia sp. NBC_00410]